MRDYEHDLSQVHHHRYRVEEAAAELKAMRQAPPNSYLPKDIRGAELGYDFWRSRLRITEDILRRYHPDQPRVPAGNSDGGQWTDGGGGFASDRSSPSVDPIKTGATSARPRSNNDLVKPVSDSDQGQRRNLEFNESQKAELRRKIGSGKGAYVESYKYLHQQVQNRLQNPGLSVAERKELEAKEFWLRKAGEINADDPNSQGNFFIRSVTGNGLRFDDKPAGPEKIQGNSNRIGAFVMKDVLETGQMPSMQRIIANDALSVTDEEGRQTLGGWGGSFNYWDMPLSSKPGDTVGDRISNNPSEYEKFISVNARALADTVRKFRLDRYPENSAEAIVQGLNAQVPAKIKLQIIDRALDGINGERGGFAGDPYDIDGYHPRFNDDDNVVGWFSRDKRLKEIDITDGLKINELNTRYNIRQSKGEFHPWQNAD